MSLVVADVPASPPTRSLISPPQPHQQTSGYTWDETSVCRLLFSALLVTKTIVVVQWIEIIMLAIILLLLLLSPAWSLAQETEEPSLVEAARRERERRANMTEAVWVITEANLKDFQGLVSTSGNPPAAASERTDVGESGTEENAEDAKTTPAAWEALFKEARLDLANAVNRGRVLELRMQDLQRAWLSEDDGVKIQQQLQETQQLIQSTDREIQAARETFQALQLEAQQAGVLPGVIRELVGELP